jgi:peptide/nickel transport system substrate-binding protein
MHFRRRTILATLALGAAALGFADAAQAQKQGGTLVMLVQPEPPTLASYQSTSGPIGQVTAKVYEGLLEYGFDLKPKPGLAKSWTVSPDGKTVTFKLQEGVKFHDGKPLTSDDVKFSILEVLRKTHPRAPVTFREVTDIETPDPLTAVFKLANPAPYMLMALSGYESPIVPKHIFGQGDIKAHPNANNPIGTGPFKFVQWEKGQFIRLDRNPDYWRKGLPYLDRVVARFIADAGTRTAAMEKGEAHFAAFAAVPWADMARVSKLPHIGVETKGYEMINPIMMLEMNHKKAPLDNVKVRQAISYAIDRQFIIDNIWFGYGKPATGPMSSNYAPLGLYNADVRQYQVKDGVKLANQLLDEAGLKRGAGGIRFKMTHDILPYGDEWKRLGEYIKQALGEIGIDVTLRHEDVPGFLKRVFTDYEFELDSDFYYNLADPVIGVHRQYATDQIRKGTVFVNNAQYSNPRVDELFRLATTENDPAKRSQQYKEAQKLIVEDAVHVWVHEMQFANVYNKKFKNLVASPLGVYASFADAWME